MTTTEALQAIHAHPAARCLRVCVALTRGATLLTQFADTRERYAAPGCSHDATAVEVLAALEHLRAAAEGDGRDALATLAGAHAAELAAAVEAWAKGYKFWRGGLHHAPRPQRPNEEGETDGE
jgi:hypothetical protein